MMNGRAFLLLGALAGGVAATEADRFLDVFSPLQTESAALSPDGRRIAYSLREGDKLAVIVREVDQPEKILARVMVATDEQAKVYMAPASRPAEAKILWMEWVGPDRVAVETNYVILAARGRPQGALFAFDYNGENARRLFTARSGYGLLNVKALNPANPREILARLDDKELAIDALTGRSRRLKRDETASIDAALKTARKADRDFLTAASKSLQLLLPDYKLDLLPHHPGNPRLLVRAQSVADSGGFLIFEPGANRLWDFVRRDPPAPRTQTHRTEAFALTDRAGVLHTGLLTLPLDPKVKRAPVVLMMPDRLMRNLPRLYVPEVQAFATMGFAVAVIDPLAASRDWTAGEANHVLSTLDLLADHYPISRRAIALFGRGTAGRYAFELAATNPGRFRCAVAVELMPESMVRGIVRNPTLDAALRPLNSPPLFAALALAWRSPRGPFLGDSPAPPPPAYPPRSAAENIIADLKDKRVDARLEWVGDEFKAAKPPARAEAFQRIESFLNEILYHYSVSLGELEISPDPVPPSAP